MDIKSVNGERYVKGTVSATSNLGINSTSSIFEKSAWKMAIADIIPNKIGIPKTGKPPTSNEAFHRRSDLFFGFRLITK